MALREEVLEKLKRKQAEQFASCLPQADNPLVVVKDEVPREIFRCLDRFIKYEAKPNAILENRFLLKNLFIYFENINDKNVLLHTNQLYWKFFLRFNVSNINDLISYLIKINTTELCLVNLDDGYIFYLSEEENNYWLFKEKLSNC